MYCPGKQVLMSHELRKTITNPDYKLKEHDKHVTQTQRCNLGRTKYHHAVNACLASADPNKRSTTEGSSNVRV
jgi:hypothetical protein